MWSEVCFIVRVCFVFVFQQIDWITRSVAAQRKRQKLIAPSALRKLLLLYTHARTHTSERTRGNAHTQTEFDLDNYLLWEKWSSSERGGLQQLMSPDAVFLSWSALWVHPAAAHCLGKDGERVGQRKKRLKKWDLKLHIFCTLCVK